MPVQSHFFIETIKGYDALREVFEIVSRALVSEELAALDRVRASRFPISNRYFRLRRREIPVLDRAGRTVRAVGRFQTEDGGRPRSGELTWL
jgi:hypothetical protein